MINLYVKYSGAGGGGSSETIEIENSIAKVNYEDRDCVSLLFHHEPTAAAVHPRIGECLRIKETSLESNEIQSIGNFIFESGFLNLDSTYGKDQSGRAYSYVIDVEIDRIKKTVTYLSSPEADPAPQAFVAVEQKMREISDRIINDTTITANHPHSSK